jgi:transposase
VSVPLCVLEELLQLRAELRRLRQDNDRLRQENDQLRRDNERLQQQREQARADLEQARRQGKRQAAPFSKGPPKPQPKTPGRQRGAAHGRHGHRWPPKPEQVDEALQAARPDAGPHGGAAVHETEVCQQ